MTLHIVEQLKNARNGFERGLEGLSADDAIKRLGHANCISWMVGHLACFEQLTHCVSPQGIMVSEDLLTFDFGKPATTPPLAETIETWKAVCKQADVWLNTLTEDDLKGTITLPNGQSFWENIGTMLQRHTWHYWYHAGEAQAIRSALGHEGLPPFIGRIDRPARYTPNAAKQLVNDMVDGLNRHEIGGMEQYWSEDMQWYGPAGIGLKPSLKAFQEEHQKPFLHAFSDKEAFDEIRIAEGDYVAAKGYQQVTHGGDYLGIPATNKPMQIKYMDFWRTEDGKLVENWVMIDLLDFLEQTGYNVENVLKFIGSKPPEFFDEID